METKTETRIGYFRLRTSTPLFPFGTPVLMDYFQVFWDLASTKEIVDWKNFREDSLETINAHLSRGGRPPEHMSATVRLFEGVLVQVGLIIATPVHKEPTVSPSMLNNILGQIFTHRIFQTPCDEETTEHREFIKSEIRRFFVPIQQHLDIYPALEINGQTTIYYEVDTNNLEEQ